MAESPAHKFGQTIGNLLEEILEPKLRKFCDSHQERHLYLDKMGNRRPIRGGKKVTWRDKYGNFHDLDFVIEKNPTLQQVGQPVAFIEAAWRRYSKHSRAKVQEIQGAILPIAERFAFEKPFLGAVLAGVFTSGSLEQLRSHNFKVIHIPYGDIVGAFSNVGIDIDFDEKTSHSDFSKCVRSIGELCEKQRDFLKEGIVESRRADFDKFFYDLEMHINRTVKRILIFPLHGWEIKFSNIHEAVSYIDRYDENVKACVNENFRKFEVQVRLSNGDDIRGSFSDKAQAIHFLKAFCA